MKVYRLIMRLTIKDKNDTFNKRDGNILITFSFYVRLANRSYKTSKNIIYLLQRKRIEGWTKQLNLSSFLLPTCFHPFASVSVSCIKGQ